MPGANTLAYLASSSATKKKCFITLATEHLLKHGSQYLKSAFPFRNRIQQYYFVFDIDVQNVNTFNPINHLQGVSLILLLIG